MEDHRLGKNEEVEGPPFDHEVFLLSPPLFQENTALPESQLDH